MDIGGAKDQDLDGDFGVENAEDEEGDRDEADIDEENEMETDVNPEQVKPKGVRSVVDDDFFKLSEMNDFLLAEEKKESRLNALYNEDVDEAEDEGAAYKYEDFFGTTIDESEIKVPFCELSVSPHYSSQLLFYSFQLLFFVIEFNSRKLFSIPMNLFVYKRVIFFVLECALFFGTRRRA